MLGEIELRVSGEQDVGGLPRLLVQQFVAQRIRHTESGHSALPLAKQVAESALTEGNLRVSPYQGQVFTDDLAPVERLIDEIIFSYVRG